MYFERVRNPIDKTPSPFLKDPLVELSFAPINSPVLAIVRSARSLCERVAREMEIREVERPIATSRGLEKGEKTTRGEERQEEKLGWEKEAG